MGVPVPLVDGTTTCRFGIGRVDVNEKVHVRAVERITARHRPEQDAQADASGRHRGHPVAQRVVGVGELNCPAVKVSPPEVESERSIAHSG